MEAKKASLLDLNSSYFKRLFPFMGPCEIVKLAMTNKSMRNKIRSMILKEVSLDYADSKFRITKNFFQILKNNYNKKIVKLSLDNFKLLLRSPADKSLNFDLKNFHFGTRVLELKIGPKMVGSRTENNQLLLSSLENFDKLNIESPKVIFSVVQFEVNGWCVYQTEDGSLFSISFTKENKFTETERIPHYPDDVSLKVAHWSSCFDRVVIAYKVSVMENNFDFYVVSAGKLDEPIKLSLKNVEILQLSIIKNKVMVISKEGDLHTWELTDKEPEYTKLEGANMKKIFTNSVLSVMFARQNRVPNLSEMSQKEVQDWISYIQLGQFRDIITYSKIDGKTLAQLSRKNLEELLGFPEDSPEINHLFLQNKLLAQPYYKNPVLTATGYNANNELGLNTGNNVITDLQDFNIRLDDFTDDVKEVRINSLASFIKTNKDRHFTCVDIEEKAGKEKNQDDEEEDNIQIDSDEDDDLPKKKNKEKKRKGSKTVKNKGGQKPQVDKKQKKFEKIKWKEITDCFQKCPKLENYVIDFMDCTKNNVYIVCHEKPTEAERNHLMLTGDAVLKVLNDPKLNHYTFDIGLKNA